MVDLLKTIETPHDPCVIVTNDIGDEFDSGSVLVGFHWFDGESIHPPRLTLDDDRSILMDQEQLRAAIAALSEFLRDEADEPSND